MRIHSWGQSSGVSGAQALSAMCITPQNGGSQDDDSEQSAAQVALSAPAELYQKLAALKQTDAASFKQVTNKVAEHFEQLASVASGPEAKALVMFARRFASAAQSGDLSALAPQTPAAQTPPAAPPPVEAPPPPPPTDAVGAAFALVDQFAPASAGSGDALAKLHALKDSSPAAFKKVMNDVASQLAHMAATSEGSDKENLQNLAVTFASRAESRDLSAIDALRPPEPAAPPPPPPAPPPPEPPVDVSAVSRSLVEGLTGGSGDSSPLARLTALKTSDAAGFKRVMNEVAQQLEAMASFEDGDDRQSLQTLAGTFASAGQSRNLSALEGLWPAPAPAPAEPPPATPPASVPQPVDAMSEALSLVDSLVPAGAGDTTSTPLSRLSALKTSNLAGFKSVMNEVARSLEAMASFEDGDDRQNLQNLAMTFASGAQHGSLSAVEALQQPSSTPAPAPAEPPPATPPASVPQPVDAMGEALSLVDSLVPAGAGDTTSTPLSRLSALKTSNLAGFKSVMNEVARSLEAMASFEDGDDRQNLQNLAATFASGAQHGSLSAIEALQPPASAPAPEPAPAPAPEPPPPPPAGWRYRQASEAYLKQVLAPNALDDAFASATALVDTLTAH